MFQIIYFNRISPGEWVKIKIDNCVQFFDNMSLPIDGYSNPGFYLKFETRLKLQTVMELKQLTTFWHNFCCQLQ